MPEFSFRLWTNKDLTKKNFPKTYSYIQQSKRYHGKFVEVEEENEDGTIEIYDILDENNKPSKHNKWAQITDLMRLEIVYNKGGYYFDTTFEILRPMYNLLNKKNKRFVGCNEVPRFKDHNILSNSFFGATPGNPILRRLLKKEKLDQIDFYDQGVDFQTGPGYLRSGIRLNDNYHIFPTTYFYPFVEEYEPGVNPPYRKYGRNKCHSKKKGKRTKKRLKSKKGYIEFPCKRYPKSYALKHWQLGKSWLISEYYTL